MITPQNVEVDVRDFDQMTAEEQRHYVAWGLQYILKNMTKAPTKAERDMLEHLQRSFAGGRLN